MPVWWKTAEKPALGFRKADLGRLEVDCNMVPEHGA